MTNIMTKSESTTNDEAHSLAPLFSFRFRHPFVIRHLGFVIVPIPSLRSCSTESWPSMFVRVLIEA